MERNTGGHDSGSTSHHQHHPHAGHHDAGDSAVVADIPIAPAPLDPVIPPGPDDDDDDDDDGHGEDAAGDGSSSGVCMDRDGNASCRAAPLLWLHRAMRPTRSVQRIDAARVEPLGFLRDFIAHNRPCVIQNAASLLGAPGSADLVARWADDAALEASIGADTEVTVDWTPDGRADSIRDGWFVSAASSRMRFGALLAALRCPTPGTGVPYVQLQNSNVESEYAMLLDREVPADVPFMTAAVGDAPEAVNLWIGDERAWSSWHKDPFENVYLVLRGRKTFTLYPPQYAARMRERQYPAATWRWDGGEGDGGRFEMRPTDDTFVHWIDPDDVAAIPQAPLVIELEPGEMLYLPQFWYHCVAQGPRTVAVNWWYPAAFGQTWHFHCFAAQVGASLAAPAAEEGGGGGQHA